MSSGRRFRVGLMAALLVLGGCEAEEYAILISAYGDDGFARDTVVDVTVRDLQSSLRATSPEITLDDVVSPQMPLRIGIELHAPGQYLVHIAATDAGAVLSAARCFSVLGVTRSEVLLVPVDDLDSDEDTWPAEETCRERSLVEGEVAELGCKNQCPTEWAVDCDDANPEINPGAPERCEDDVDQDCDGEDAPCEDADGDGFTGCRPDAADTSDCDCDDGTRTVNPGVVESSDPADDLCENDVDDDCDGQDQRCDGDGDGVPSCAEDSPPGGTCDCDDRNKAVSPGATETPGGECDGLDNNCNGLVDEVSACLSDDLDGDGATMSEDCNDCNAGAAPGRSLLVCGNGIDEDCAGGDETCSAGDGDRDGFVGQEAGGPDCDDADPAIYPGAPDPCGGGSSDCSGSDATCENDGDRDGWNADHDCDDGDPAINPARGEECNGVDDDCDGVVNEVGSAGAGCVFIPGRDPDGDGWVDIDFASDLQNCGSCRNDCNPACDGTLCQADACDSGSCTCDGGPTCGGGEDSYCCPDGCKNLRNDTGNCGGCGVACPAPPCQSASCDGGVCSTRNEPDGTPCGGGRYCCGGACVGECDPGEPDDEGCGLCGRRERRCTAGCRWGEWGSCNGQGECSILEVDSEGCGNCGHRQRVCGGDCEWEGWGPCFDQGCEPGDTESQGCGHCGTETRTCRNDCTWGNYGDCAGEGACAPDAEQSAECGRCGTRTRTCTNECSWGAWGDCGGEGACTPGDRDPEPCGNCGTQERVCGNDCQWGDFGNCTGQGECAPDDTTTQGCSNCAQKTCGQTCAWGSCQGGGECSEGGSEPCGNCGTRLCGAGCTWGSCQNQGECSSGDPPRSCGNCGTQECGASCSWGSCQSEGECTPGARSANGCSQCAERICSQGCSWGACQGGGECTPDAEEPCGMCGRRTCGQTCAWGSCQNEGQCTPGATQTNNCPTPPNQTRVCRADCTWGDWVPTTCN